MSTVAGLAMAIGDQDVWAMDVEGVEQPLDLAALQTHQRRSHMGRFCHLNRLPTYKVYAG